MQELYDQLSRVAPTAATVLLIGESGTGKELAAQTLHELSAPEARAVPAAQLRRGLAAADRERAVRPRARQLHRRRPPAQGLLRARPRRHALPRRDHRDADGAAGEAAARARDRHRSCASAATTPIATDVRVIAATNRDPEKAVRGRQAARGPLPPAERVPDPHAAAARARHRHRAARPATSSTSSTSRKAPARRFAPATLAALYAHSWPGNVRELQELRAARLHHGRRGHRVRPRAARR